MLNVAHVYNSTTGKRTTLSALLDDVATADVVFVGESHTDEVTHRVELAIYEGLLARRQNRVVLAMEMFTRDLQSSLDDYVSGAIDEATFAENVRLWPNYQTGYRALVERARRDKLPVVASNAPSSITRTIMMGGGKAAFDSLDESSRNLIATKLLPNSEAYWERYRRVTRGHGGAPNTDDATSVAQHYLYSTQSIWDNTMGQSCAQALERYPESSVLHINGSFHSNYHQGTVEQFVARRPKANVVTVSIVTTTDLSQSAASLDRQLADYVIFAEARNRGVEDGWHAANVRREMRYRLHVPSSASPNAPVSLLVWLGEEETPTEDAFAYWKLAVGADAAVAVVQAPYREHKEQLFVAGRWYFSDSFRADMREVADGVDAIADYVSRYYPIDDQRIIIAGTGAGATAVASTALWTNVPRTSLAFAPARFGKLGELALPTTQPPANLEIYADPLSRPWWDGEATSYASIGFAATVFDYAGDPGTLAKVRTALHLPSATATSGEQRLLVIADDSVVARQWAELYRLSLARTNVSATVVTVSELANKKASVPPGAVLQPLLFAGENDPAVPTKPRIGADKFADGSALPLAPGGFGGTTVVVLPRGISAKDRAAWLALEEGDVLKKRSRFFHLRVAELAGERSIANVLAEIRAAHRSNVLIVPAVFCESAEYMRTLRTGAGPLDGLTVTWLPGLGGQLHHTVE